MEIRIRSKNMQVTEHLEKYITEKFSKVEKFLPRLIEKQEKDKKKTEGAKARVDMEIEIEKITKGQNKGDVYRVEVLVFLPGTSLRAEDVSSSPKEAVSEVRYELQRQVKQYKDKQATLQKKGEMEAKKIREKSGIPKKEEGEELFDME